MKINLPWSLLPRSFLPLGLLGFKLAIAGACTPEHGQAAIAVLELPVGSTAFSTGFEAGETQPTWNDTPESVVGVSGYVSGISPECSPRSEVAHSGTQALMFSGTDTSTTRSYVYFKVFQVSLPVTASTQLSYWLYPQNPNARFVGVDLHFTDGSVLRDSGSRDSNNCSLHPAGGHCSRTPVGQWTRIHSEIGGAHAGKTIDRISVAYDQAPSTGQFRGFIDDISIKDAPGPEWSMASIPVYPVPADVCASTRVRQALLEMTWREAEPQEGQWNASYFQQLRDAYDRLQGAGCQRIVLNYGLHDAPGWLLGKPHARYINQAGVAYTQSNEPNLIHNTQLRTYAQRYTQRVFAEFGTSRPFSIVRVGGGHWGELTYPQVHKPDGTLFNNYYSFDATANASKPEAIRAYVPCSGDPALASRFLSWHLSQLTAYQNWQIASVRAAGHTGTIAVLYPSWGLRAGDVDAAVATNLCGTSSPEINGEVQRGFDHARHIGAITDPAVAKWGTWGDQDGTLDWLRTLNPPGLTLELMGENGGPGTADKVSLFVRECRENSAAACFWIRYGEASTDFLRALL